ncbi:MAG: hypothetical protein ABI175_11630 [Polyangiales bacterium]
MTTTRPAGTRILPGRSLDIGSIGDPGLVEGAHWGWLYFDLLKEAAVPMQVFIRRASSGVKMASVGHYAVSSSDDRSMPLGAFGKAQREKDHEWSFIVEGDTSSLDAPRSARWMRDCGDDWSLAEISVPGTHDSGARDETLAAGVGLVVGGGMTGGTSAPMAAATFACQEMTIGQQLEAGIRYLDMRLAVHGFSDDVLHVHHTFVDQRVGFESVLRDLAAFLGAHPTETIFLCVKHEKYGGELHNGIDFDVAFDRYFRGPREQWFAKVTRLPGTLADVRGQIVLLRRFDIKPKYEPMGVPVPGWPDNQEGDVDGGSIHVHDVYAGVTIEDKWSRLCAVLDVTKATPLHKVFINHVSAFLGLAPKDLARILNKRLRERLAADPGGPLGIVVMDLPDAPLIEAILAANALRAKGRLRQRRAGPSNRLPR